MSAAPRRVRVRLVLFGCLLALAALAAPGLAQAAIPWSGCATAGYECAHVPVPLDRSGAVPGSVSLAVTRVRAQTDPTNTAVVALAGGPGQAALPLAADFAWVLAPAIGQRDLLVFDQRGTGLSGALDCPALRRATSLVRAVSGCASELGARRGSYRTADTVEDLEAIRAAAGYDKLVLFGVSYGTKVAEAYAAAHPDRVGALVLDSVVLPEGPDPFSRSSLSAAPRVLGDLCAHDACRQATPDVRGDLRRLAQRLRHHRLHGKVVIGSGRRVSYAMGQSQLVDILLAGDLNPTLRAELPGSMRAALQGDSAPLLRLSVRSEGLTTGASRPARAATTGSAGWPAPSGWAAADGGDSDALYLATICEEVPFPWTRTAGLTQRAGEAVAASKRIPRSQLGPFSPRAALQGGPIPFCVGWPTASATPPASAPLPAVPTLLLEGQMDLRTPYEDAAALAATLPGAALVEVPFTGHSVLSSDESTCARTALATFFAGGTPGACATGDNPYRTTPRPPTRLRDVHPEGGHGRVGRTIAAVDATVTDARRQIIGELLAQGRMPKRVGGLRAGLAIVHGASSFRLRHYEYLPHVQVSGLVPFRGTARLTVHGGGTARGDLAVTASGAVSGTLGGHRVHLGASASAGRLPTPREVLARPRLTP